MFKEKVIMVCQAMPVNCLMSVVVLIALRFPFLIKAINFKTDLKVDAALYNNVRASRWNLKLMHILYHVVARQRQGGDPLFSITVKIAETRQWASPPKE